MLALEHRLKVVCQGRGEDGSEWVRVDVDLWKKAQLPKLKDREYRSEQGTSTLSVIKTLQVMHSVCKNLHKWNPSQLVKLAMISVKQMRMHVPS